jgi:hypothetical protein
VVIIECRDELGPDLSVTIPAAAQPDVSARFYGASLPALVKLARKKRGSKAMPCFPRCHLRTALAQLPMQPCWPFRGLRSR